MAHRLILDSGAIIALAAGDALMRAHLRVARSEGVLVLVPALVIAETIRGADSDAPVNRALKLVGEVTPITETIARLAGRLLRRAGRTRSQHTPPTLDALIVAVAILRGGGTLLTGDPGDLLTLAANHPEVSVRHWMA